MSRHVEKARNTLQSLNSQILLHKNALQSTQSDIKSTQAKIEGSYKDRDSNSIMDHIASLDEFILVQQDHKYGKIFAEQIAQEYQSVIKFSENKLQIIQANIPALSQ